MYAAANPVNAIDPDGLCALRMFGGGYEMYFGAGLIAGALSGPPGWVTLGAGVVGSLMVLNGADNLIAGSRSLGGEYKQAFLESAIHHYVQNDLAANLLYMGTQIGLGYAGIRAYRGIQTTKLYHGTRHPQELFEQGIDVARGGGQLGPGFYVTEELETAEWFARSWTGGGASTTGQPKLLVFDIPKRILKRLRIIELGEDSLAYRRLSKAWKWRDPIPDDLSISLMIMMPSKHPFSLENGGRS